LRHAVALFFAAAAARTYPRVAWLGRNRTWLIQETLLPVLSVSALAMTYKWLNAPSEYVGVVILGAAMTTFWLNVLWSLGAHLYWERDSGNLELYIMAPAPMMGILAGMAAGGMLTTVVRAVAIFAAGVLLFGVSFRLDDWWLLLIVFALTMLALYGLGMTFASLFLLFGREAWHVVNLLQEPVYLLTGMNFPLTAMQKIAGYAVPGVALLIPLTAGVDAMRQLLFPYRPGDAEAGVPTTGIPGFLPVWVEVLILSVLGVVFLGLAKFCLDRMERKARESGTLGARWQ
jgi:ABC-2 type transport system permease protein